MSQEEEGEKMKSKKTKKERKRDAYVSDGSVIAVVADGDNHLAIHFIVDLMWNVE